MNTEGQTTILAQKKKSWVVHLISAGKNQSITELGHHHGLCEGRFKWMLLLLLVGWVIYLHLFRLNFAGGLWRDEISSLDVAAAATWKAFCLGQSHDSFPLFNVFLLRIWLFLGNGSLVDAAANDSHVRVFGMLGGLALVASLFWNATRVFKSLPIISLAFFAASPSVIQWGDSVRAYSLGSALSVLLFGTMWRLIRKPTLLLYCVSSVFAIVSVWTLYGNAFFVLSICGAAGAVAATRRDWKLFGAIIGIGMLSALSLGLNLPIFRELTSIKEGVSQFITFPLIMESWWTAWTEPFLWMGYIWLLLVGLALFLALTKILRPIANQLAKNEREQGLYVSMTLLVSIGGFLFYLFVVDVPPQVWYFLPIGGLISAAFDSLWPLLGKQRNLFSVLLILALILVGATAATTLKALKQKQTNIDIVAAQIEGRASASDLILVAPLYQASTFARYYSGPATIQVWPPHKPEQLAYQRIDVMLSAIYSEKEAILPLWDEMGKTLRSGGKVWIAGDIVVVPADRPPPWVKPGTLFPGQSLVGPYLYTWGAQVFYFLANHAKSASVTDKFDITHVNRWEAIQQVVVFEGWNDPAK